MKRRLFVAIDFPQEVKLEIAKLSTKLAKAYREPRWEKAENLHLTLKFLGYNEVAPEVILGRLREKLKGVHSFSIRFGALGLIMNLSAVVIVEIEKSEELLRLYHMINNCFDEIGFKRERRAFHPHVTIGRVREKDTANIVQLSPLTFSLPQLEASNTVLYESKLTEKGAVHTALGVVPLVTSHTG